MVECEHCGEETADPQACAECGGVYCHDHDKPLLHECAAIEGAVGDDVFDPSATGQEGGLLDDAGGTLVWAGIVLGTVVLLVGLGVVTGVIAPSTLVPAADPPASGSGRPGDAGGPAFDEAAFRTAVLDRMNDWRADRDRSALSTVEGRRVVAETIAEDMAAVDYFENPDVQDSTRFAPKQRLADNGYGCAESNNVLYLTGFGIPVDTASGQTRLTNTSQTADWVSDRLRSKLGEELFDPAATTHALGVHLTSERLVYVVYVVC